MKLSFKAILLAGAALLFVLSAVTEGASFDLLAFGLALVAGALFVEDSGLGKRGRFRR